MRFLPALLVLPCFQLLLATPAGAEVDPRLVGVWTAKVGPATITWDVAASGIYVARVEADGPPPGELGAIEASNGRWSSRANNFRTDQGTYSLTGDEQLTLVGQKGPVQWTRLSGESQIERPPALPENRNRITLKEVLPAALAHARLWQPDAVLVGAGGMCAADGTFDLTRPNAMGITFHSPASNQGLLLSPAPTGDIVWLPGPTPIMDLTLPIGSAWLDPAEMMPKAAAAGYPVGPVNPVNLKAFPNAAGAANRVAWQIGATPMLSKAFYLDAVTGQKATWHELSGNVALQQRIETWRKGKQQPMGDDFASWRAAADDWAQEWAIGQRLYEVWVTGAYRGALKPGGAVFLYFAEASGPGGRGKEIQSISVAVSSRGLKGYINKPLKQLPQPLPADAIAPDKAASVLWGLNPQVPPDHTYLQLLHVPEGEEASRHWPPEFGYRRSNLGGIFLHRGPVPKGPRWLWRMIARRPGAETGVGIGGNYQSHLGAVHCDALTGQALDEPAPTFGQTKFR